ncbi:RNA polymerase sigma factor, sigma-70 family [Isosphaera pallida ATCC 43644]|uniref:RNA polymerase sigma factor, sigma-70 family n=1 Tax=Isosphaera pallida (strain ATCC 43644 / DSM 9630 / IS1B) TaxID=575540 RepID=E8QZ53_ISOPI|nr:RNA polymerase sigma factor, sigma-70 family [Isosphaera pallida ATCC 43644]
MPRHRPNLKRSEPEKIVIEIESRSTPAHPLPSATSARSIDPPTLAFVESKVDSDNRPPDNVTNAEVSLDQGQSRRRNEVNAPRWLESWDRAVEEAEECTGNLTPAQSERVASHAAMALRVARGYARGRRLAGLDQDELESTALWALIRAVRHHCPERGPFLPYAASVIRHACANLARREGYRIERFVHWTPSGRHDPPSSRSQTRSAACWTSRHPHAREESSEERATRLEDHDALRHAVERLPESQRRVIQSRLAGDPPRVIAQTLGLTHRQVYRLYNRALIRLRREFDERQPDQRPTPPRPRF